MTLLGIDVSHHQAAPNFGAVKAAGNAFVFVKATEGVGYTDPAFAATRAAVRAAGLVVGAYHFARAGDLAAEADYFCSVVGALQPGDLVALDWETTAPNPPAWCKAWLDRVSSKLGVRPLIYMNQSTRDGFDWSPVVAGNYGPWLAVYDNNPAAVPNPGRWPAVAIKQFTSSGVVPGVAGLVDRNVFLGDATALAAYGYQPTGVDMSPAELLNTPLVGSDGKPYPLSVFIVQTNATAYHASKQADALSAQIDKLASAPAVNVDAGAVASALAGNTTFLAALAKAVNDDAAARLKS